MAETVRALVGATGGLGRSTVWGMSLKHQLCQPSETAARDGSSLQGGVFFEARAVPLTAGRH